MRKQSAVAIHTTAVFEGTPLASGTSFIYELDGPWLITAWHMVTGRDNTSGRPLAEHGGSPDRLILRYPLFVSSDPATGQFQYDWVYREVPLYVDASYEEPLFRWHPRHRQAVDVVAIPSPLEPDDASLPIGLFSIDGGLGSERLRMEVSMDAFVLGYPRNLSGHDGQVIWKRASIASNPESHELNPDLLPCYYIDTATRQGMSGGPVVVRSNGFLTEDRFVPGRGTPRPVIGTIDSFAGLYSGRIMGEDEMAAQLGIVWTELAITEVIRGGVLADSPFWPA